MPRSKHSKKNLLYLEILRWTLPYARNVQTWRFWRRLQVDLYIELELVHGIPQLMEDPGMTMADVYWINCQASNYARACRESDRPASEVILRAIEDLVSLVPAEWADKLAWRGRS